MKAKILTHEVREVDGSIILFMTYEYKENTNTVSIIDLPEFPTSKIIKQYIRTAEKAINQELKEKEDNASKLKREIKQKQKELTEMRKFVNSRWVDHESIKKAISDFKEQKK
jgi:hypothetical protein